MSYSDRRRETGHPVSRPIENETIASRFGDVAEAQSKNRIYLSLLDLLQKPDAELRKGIEEICSELRQGTRRKAQPTLAT